LNEEQFRRFTARPERLIEVVRGIGSKTPIVIDEVQRVPELLSGVHLLIEEDPGRQFVLTGSSARKLKRTGIDLLAGRAIRRTCHPFMACELGDDFDLNVALSIGLIPLIYGSDTPQEVLQAYLAFYLREEVQIEGLVRNVGDFSRFLESISFSHGGVLTIADVARECEVGRKTVESYIGILEDLLIAERLPVFSRRAKRNLVRHNKFYLFDSGVFRSLRPKGPLDRPSEIDGAALEGVVYQHLRAWIDYSKTPAELFYWRTKSGSEIDFVVYGEESVCAIEVKLSRRVNRKDLRALKAFRSDYPMADTYLLYCGEERLFIDDVLCLPCADFLKQLVPDRPLWVT
jgi:predicted AAA+ superfamily ATPase